MPPEVYPEGFGPIFTCVGPKNALETRIFKKLKKLKKRHQGFTQAIRKHKKKEIRKSTPSQMHPEGFAANFTSKMSLI